MINLLNCHVHVHVYMYVSNLLSDRVIVQTTLMVLRLSQASAHFIVGCAEDYHAQVFRVLKLMYIHVIII
jgi:hypothetical protein